jgi:signal transduction histidine kinase/ligand-binding sensor domain-containing protein
MQRSLFFLACFFVSVNCIAQQYPFVYYTPKDGLVNSRVRSIKQDGKGRMYFITYGGLSVYDGARFTNYNSQNGLANELVNDMAELTSDSFLIATNTQKLNTLINGKVGVYETADGFYPIINRFFKSSDGHWYAATDDGLYILKEKKFAKLPLSKKQINLNQCLDRIIEWGNYFFIVPWNADLPQKLILYNKVTGSAEDVFTKEALTGITKDANGLIWIITPSGIFHPDVTSIKKGKIKLLPSATQDAITKQSNANIYFDEFNGGWIYGGNTIKNIAAPFFSISETEALKTSNLTDFFRDREGIIWLASDGNGVAKLKTTGIQLLTTVMPGRKMFFTAVTVQKDTAWIFDAFTNAVYRQTKNETKAFILGEKISVWSIYIIRDDLFLFSGKKIFRVRQKNNQASYSNYQLVFNDESLDIGAGTAGVGGYIIAQVKKSLTDFALLVFKDGKVVDEHKINYLADQLATDSKGRLWVATRDNHLIGFQCNPNEPSNYLQPIFDFSSQIKGLAPRAITIDKQNNIWIGTRYNGLYHFQIKNDSLVLIKQYTTKDGLTDNFIHPIACDEDNTIWIGTQTGLDKLFLKDGKYILANIGKNINVFQRVNDIEASGRIVYVLNSGSSLLKIIKDSLPKIPVQPSLLLTELKINDTAFDLNTHVFNHHQNNLSFALASPSFLDEKSISYSYLLQGSGNEHWSEPTTQTNLSFINLSPGKYTLQVRCFYPESMYPSQTASYSFTILPPWWQTWWFRTALGILIAGVIIWLVRSYYRRKLEKKIQLLEKQQAIEKERTRIATDMHDDLGAGLSRIKFLSETIGIKKQQQKPIEEDIVKIREYSHQMIDKMGEIVWALNEKNDSLTDLLSFTRAYSAEYLSQNGIACEVNMPDDVKDGFIRGEFRRNIFLSVKEVLHNIVKHAEANHVHINIEAGKNLVLKIKDDGKGFDRMNIRPFSNGLSNIEKRMKDIGGSSEIKNGEGTMVKLIAPLPH